MRLLVVLSLVGAALATPGGLTYSAYSTAYGPLARSALLHGGFGLGAPALAAPGFAAAPALAAPAFSAAPAVAAAPVAYAAPAPVAYAAPAVAAAPAAAVVPVTRVSAQPAVVQDLVDVAHPKLATRRYEIRRPAVEKKFYDIEERIVVRPAGSAVVELDTPVSANQRGPTEVRPAAPAVALRAYAPAHLAAPALPAFLSATYPAALPISHRPQVVEPSQEGDFPQAPAQPSPSFPQPSPPSAGFPQPGPPSGSFPQANPPSAGFPQQQFDDSDSVSVENPEISARINRPQPSPQNLQTPLFRSQLPQFPRPESPAQEFARRPSPEFSFTRSQFAQFLESAPLAPQFSRSQFPGLPDPQAAPRPEQPAPLQQEPELPFARSQQPLRPQPELPFARSQQPLRPQPELSPRQGPTPQPLAQPRFSELESRPFEIPSPRQLPAEISQANQERYIQLLTGRGPVAEVRSASEPLRGRVISATPAPQGAEPSERVNTRRIVVSRPIQTVQEVDVVEPFTKLERVAVHKPAVVKTAHVELAAVPAAVPAVHAVPAAVTVAPHYLKK